MTMTHRKLLEEEKKKKQKKASRTANPEPTKQGEQTNETSRLSTMSPAVEGQESIGIQSSQRAGQDGARGSRNYIIDGEKRGWRMENGQLGSGKGGRPRQCNDNMEHGRCPLCTMQALTGIAQVAAQWCLRLWGPIMGHCHGRVERRYSTGACTNKTRQGSSCSYRHKPG